MSNILTGFNMQGNDPIDNRIVSPSKFETLEEYLQRVPIQKRYYGLSFYALDENNELRHYTFQTSLIEPTIDDDEEEIERLDKELQEHVNNKEIHKTSEEIRSEIVDADIPDTIARVQWTLDKIEEAVNTVMGDIVDGASDEYNTLKKIQDKIVELRTEMESQLYGDDGGEVLKTLEQALKFLNQYKDFIVDIPDNYVNKQDIVDNLNTDDPTKVLSARQGKVLSETLTNYFDSAMASIRAETNRATGAENRIEAKLDSEIDRSTAEDIRIQGELDAEEDRAQSEEKRIENKLDAEIERSTTKDIELGNQIIAETNRAEGEEQRIETKLDNEITRSTAKDEDHDKRIEALEGETHVQNTDVGTTSQTFQLQMGKPGNKIKNEDAAISVRNADDSDYVNFIAKNATFKGDLIVEGQSFVTEAETVEIKDNILLLNKGEIGSGVTKGMAGLQIDRGTEPDFQILFVESDRRFKAGEEGDLQCLALRDDDGSMINGMFTSWDSTTHRLKTTNIIPTGQKLFFNNNSTSLSFTNHTYTGGAYSSTSFTFNNSGGNLFFSAEGSNLNIDTDKTRFKFYKDLIIPSSIISSGNSISLLNSSGATIATFGSPSTINSSLNVANQVIIKGVPGTKLIMQSSDANNFNLIESQNSSGTILSKLGYYGTFWGIDNKKIATEEFANNKFLPLAGGTMTGVILMNNNVVIQSKNSSGTAKRLIGKGSNNVTYIGDSDGHTFLYSDDADISHIRNGTSYRIWDSYNLTNPVTYTTDTYNYATLRNKDGQYFTYIKAGTSGLLPHSKATLVSRGSGSLGTSDQSFNAAYINNLHTNKVTFGDAGSFIDTNKSGDSDHKGIGFYTSQSAGCPVYVGSLCVSDDYVNSAPNIPTNGIYSKGIIYIENGIGFRNSIWTNDLTPNRNYSGYLQVLDAYDAANAGSPTNYGTVLQVNSKKDHWANQLWFGNNDNMYLRRMNYGSTTYGEWNRLLTNKDVNIIQTKSSSNPTTLPVNQIFYSEIKGVAGTPTPNGLLFSVQGDDEGIQLWASSFRNELYYRTKWTSYGDWIKLVTEFDLNSYLTKTEASTLYYPYNGRGYLSITSTGKPVMSNNQGYAVKDKDGNEREVLWMGPNNALYLGNTPQYTLGQLDLRCTTLTHNGSSIATQNYVTNQLSNYLPLTGGTLTGQTTISTSNTSVPLIINYAASGATDCFIRFNLNGTASGAVGFLSSKGTYLYNYSNSKYLFLKNDGVYFGTSSSDAKLLTSADLSSYATQSWVNSQGFLKSADMSGYATQSWVTSQGYYKSGSSYPLFTSGVYLAANAGTTGGWAREYWVGNSSSTGATGVGFGGYGNGDTPNYAYIGVGANLNYSSVNNLKVYTDKVTFGNKTLATVDQIPSIPSISISNSGSGNAVTAITASGHTLTVTKGATYLTSSSLSGYATQSWVTSQGYLTSSSLSGYATQTWVNNKNYAVRESDNVLISHSNEFNFTASSNTSIVINYRGGSGSYTSAAITEYRFYNGQGSFSNVNILANSFTGSLIGNASSATKLGSSTVGGTAKPIYLSSGTATACSATVGSSTVPVYMSSGTITQCSTTLGVSITGNAATATTATKLGSSTVGSTSLPIYLNAGTPAVCSSTLGVSITGNAATATNATQLGGTAASSYVKANDNISRLTNDRAYVRSTSTLRVNDIQVTTDSAGTATGVLYVVLEK
jgi:hypothetical protein|nr:MAG TPA: Nuclear pore complex protein [Crassvirales sp.]